MSEVTFEKIIAEISKLMKDIKSASRNTTNFKQNK